MILISHRGNIDGKKPHLENSPSYIDEAIELGYDVEVDLWLVDDKFYLGHDEPQYKVDLEWLISHEKKLWVHCKNAESLENLTSLTNHSLNYFWHQSDDYVITSKKYIWVFPGRDLIRGSIAVLPETWKSSKSTKQMTTAFGICTDYPETFRKQYS